MSRVEDKRYGSRVKDMERYGSRAEDKKIYGSKVKNKERYGLSFDLRKSAILHL